MSLFTGILGITLMLPVYFSLLTPLGRIDCLLLAALFNVAAIRRHWLNTAVVLQSILLLLLLTAYTLIQHLRY